MELRLGVDVELSRQHLRPGEQEYFGTTSGPADAGLLRAQLTGAGFTMLTDTAAQEDQQGTGAGALALVAYRGATTVTVNCSGGPWHSLYVGALDRDGVPGLDVKEGSFSWAGVQWPAYFSGGKVISDDGDSLIVEAAVDDASAVIARYRAWASERGLELEDPLDQWEAEPDLWLEQGVRFRDARFLGQVGVEDGVLTLYLNVRS